MKWKDIMNEYTNPNVMSAEGIVDYFTKINGNDKKKAFQAITIWAERSKKNSDSKEKEKIDDVLKKAKELE